MQVRDVVLAAEALAPAALAESWDNVGLLVGDPADPVRRALLTIDYTPEVAAEAQQEGCEVVLCYHPPLFHAVKRLTAGSLVYAAARAGRALYAFHTCLDLVDGGTNDLLADILGLTNRRPLRPRPSPPGAPVLGLGRVGALEPTSRPALLARIKTGLGVQGLLVSGPTEGTVARAAACAGACGDLVADALAAGAGLYLTGELRHHDALTAAAAGMTVVCALHSNTERPFLPRLAALLGPRLPGLDLVVSRADRDPFAWT